MRREEYEDAHPYPYLSNFFEGQCVRAPFSPNTYPGITINRATRVEIPMWYAYYRILGPEHLQPFYLTGSIFDTLCACNG